MPSGNEHPRLKPTVHTSGIFASLLAHRHVPTARQSPLGGLHTRVPLVCSEFYYQYRHGKLRGVKLAIVADMARDAFVAEGGGLALLLFSP